MRNHKLFIQDILNAMEAIEKFVKGMDFKEFLKDDKTISAVIRKFEIVGEATKNITDFIKDKYPEIPWKDMAGMSDRLIHGYFGIDFKIVWDTITKEIPGVKSKLQQVLVKMEMEK